MFNAVGNERRRCSLEHVAVFALCKAVSRVPRALQNKPTVAHAPFRKVLRRLRIITLGLVRGREPVDFPCKTTSLLFSAFPVLVPGLSW